MNFNHRASTYDAFAIAQRSAIDWALRQFPEALSVANKDIIELGVGTGILTQQLFNQNPKSITAVDISSEMLKIASLKFPSNNSIQWILDNAWDFKHESVDCIFSAHLLHWSKNPVSILRNWKKLLKPGGTAFLVFFIQDTLKELYELMPEIKFLSWKTHADWESIMIASGFKILKTQSHTQVFTFNTAMAFFKMLQKTGVTRSQCNLNYSVLKNILNQYQTKHSTLNGVRSTWSWCCFLIQ